MTWTLDDIPWDHFDAGHIDPRILSVVKAAALVERNAADYAAYLRNVFADDAAFQGYAEDWRREEEQHGDALGLWAERADPDFDYAAACTRFTDGYRIDVGADTSVRGSRTGELIARCIVETGTSSFYSALRDATSEPTLRWICHKVAGDEFRHYKLFYTAMKEYQVRENIPAWRRLMVAVGRIRESEDDELAYAYFAANAGAGETYDRARCSQAYGAHAFSVYQRRHAERGASMVLKAAGLNPQGLMGTLAGRLLWRFIAHRAGKMADDLARHAA